MLMYQWEVLFCISITSFFHIFKNSYLSLKQKIHTCLVDYEFAQQLITYHSAYDAKCATLLEEVALGLLWFGLGSTSIYGKIERDRDLSRGGFGQTIRFLPKIEDQTKQIV